MSKVPPSEVSADASDIDAVSDIVTDVLPDERIAYVREELEIDSREEPASITYIKNNKQVAGGAAVVLALVFLAVFQVLGIVLYGAILVCAFSLMSKGTIVSRKVITECLTDRAFYFHDEESGGLRRTELGAISKVAYSGTQLDALTPHGRVSIVFDKEQYAEAWHNFIRARGARMRPAQRRQGSPTAQKVYLPAKKVVEPTRPANRYLVDDMLIVTATPTKPRIEPAAPTVADAEDPFGDVLSPAEAARVGTPEPVVLAAQPGPASQPAAAASVTSTDSSNRKVTPEYARAVIPKVKAKIEKLDDLLLEEKINEAQYEQQHGKYSKMLSKLEAIAARGP